MQKAIAENDGKEFSDEDLIVKYALGDKQFNEVKAMDLSVAGNINLILFIQAAFMDISFEEAQKRFQPKF